MRFADNQAQRHEGRETTLQVHGLRAAVPRRREDDKQRALDAVHSQQADNQGNRHNRRQESVDRQARAAQKRTGKSHYTHKRLRTAINSIAFYLPYLFTYQEKGCEWMPNTNNKVEGVFTDLKKNLNNHSDMGEAGRKRFINGFFLALEGCPMVKGKGYLPNRRQPSDSSSSFAAYSSRGCSPAEPRYASTARQR